MIGWTRTPSGSVVSCVSAGFQARLDRADADYWRSLGYVRMAAVCLERAEAREKLMGRTG